MNIFERWFIKRVIRRLVVQGPTHTRNITELYSMIRDACDKEFTEDNAATMDAFLKELFCSTQKAVLAAKETT